MPTAERARTKGRAPDIAFPASVVNGTRRRCRLTALEAAAAAWCRDRGRDERPDLRTAPDAGAVATWLERLGVLVIAGTVELFQLECGSFAQRNRRLEWRADFEVRKWDEQYLNSAAVGYLLGIDRSQQQHKTVRLLVQSGYLLGYSFYEGHDARHRAAVPMGGRKRRAQPTPGATRWRFHPDDVARFILEHPEQYDGAQVRGNPRKALAAEARRKRKWLRVPEVAARLGRSPGNVRDLLRHGDLQGVLMRDRQSISYYVRPVWVLDYERTKPPGRLRPLAGRAGTDPAIVARRAAILAERERLQAKHDPEAKRLLCEIRDTAGRRRKARELSETAMAAD